MNRDRGDDELLDGLRHLAEWHVSTVARDEQLTMLTRALAGAGAMELPHLVAAFEHSKTLTVGNELLAALEKSPAVPPSSTAATCGETPGCTMFSHARAYWPTFAFFHSIAAVVMKFPACVSRALDPERQPSSS